MQSFLVEDDERCLRIKFVYRLQTKAHQHLHCFEIEAETNAEKKNAITVIREQLHSLSSLLSLSFFLCVLFSVMQHQQNKIRAHQFRNNQQQKKRTHDDEANGEKNRVKTIQMNSSVFVSEGQEFVQRRAWSITHMYARTNAQLYNLSGE